jgi:hypothetical protein
MTSRYWGACIIGATLMIGACGNEEATRETPPIEDTVFGEMHGTLDKARHVSETSRGRMDQLNEALEQGERD